MSIVILKFLLLKEITIGLIPGYDSANHKSLAFPLSHNIVIKGEAIIMYQYYNFLKDRTCNSV